MASCVQKPKDSSPSPLLVAAMERVEPANKNAGRLAYQGDEELVAGQLAHAERSYRGALALLPSDEHTVARAQILYALGGALNLQHQPAQAERVLLEAENIFIETEGLSSLRLGLCLSSLRTAQQRQGRYAEAEVTAQAESALFEKVLGPSDPRTLESVNTLAALFALQRQFAQLIQFVLPRMSNFEGQPQLSEEHKGEIAATLAVALLQQRRPKDAQTYSLQALAHFQNVKPLPTEDIAQVEALTGKSLLLSGKPAEAEAYLKRAMARRQDLARNDSLAQTAFLLGHTLYTEAQRAPALDAYKLGLATLESPQGTARADELQGQFALFLCSHEQDLKGWPERAERCSEAERFVRQALTHAEHMQGSDREVSRILEYLGLVLQMEQNFCEAERSFSRALTLRESAASAATHPSRVKLQIELGMAQFAQGKLAQAKASLNTALSAAREEQYRPDASTVRAQQRLGVMLYAEGQIQQAQGAFDQGNEPFVQAVLDGSAFNDAGVLDNAFMSSFFDVLIRNAKGQYQGADFFAQGLQDIARDDHDRSGEWVLSMELRAVTLRQTGQYEQARAQHTQVSELCASPPTAARQACALVQRPEWFKPCPRCRGTRGATALELMRAMDALRWRIDRVDWTPAQGDGVALCTTGGSSEGPNCGTEAPWAL